MKTNPPINFQTLQHQTLSSYCLQPTNVTSHYKTPTENVFSYVLSCEAISGNITATISDHLSPFLCAPSVLSNHLCNKSNVLEKDWSNFKKDNYILDYFAKYWFQILQLDQQKVNLPMESNLDHFNCILDIHAPYKKS